MIDNEALPEETTNLTEFGVHSQPIITSSIFKQSQVTLNIADNKFDTFLEFIKTLNYVKVDEIEEVALEESQNSLKQVKMMQEGKLLKQSAKEFLNEL